MNDDKRFVGMYFQEMELIQKVEELKESGWQEDHIYVLVKDKEDLSMLRNRTSTEVKSADSSVWDRFVSFFSGEDHVRRAVSHLGFDTTDTERYYKDLENGGMLLYVDRGELNDYYEKNSLFNEPRGVDANAPGSIVGGVATTPLYEEPKTTPPSNTEEDIANRNPKSTFDLNKNELDTAPTDHLTDDERKMKLREERLEVDKQRQQSGGVEIEKEVIEEEQSVDVNVSHDEVVVERKPVSPGEDYEANEIHGTDGEKIRIPITEEKVEVTKKPVVTEEIVVKKEKVDEQETIEETVKREEAHVKKEGNVRVEEDNPENRF